MIVSKRLRKKEIEKIQVDAYIIYSVILECNKNLFN